MKSKFINTFIALIFLLSFSYALDINACRDLNESFLDKNIYLQNDLNFSDTCFSLQLSSNSFSGSSIYFDCNYHKIDQNALFFDSNGFDLNAIFFYNCDISADSNYFLKINSDIENIFFIDSNFISNDANANFLDYNHNSNLYLDFFNSDIIFDENNFFIQLYDLNSLEIKNLDLNMRGNSFSANGSFIDSYNNLSNFLLKDSNVYGYGAHFFKLSNAKASDLNISFKNSDLNSNASHAIFLLYNTDINNVYLNNISSEQNAYSSFLEFMDSNIAKNIFLKNSNISLYSGSTFFLLYNSEGNSLNFDLQDNNVLFDGSNSVYTAGFFWIYDVNLPTLHFNLYDTNIFDKKGTFLYIHSSDTNYIDYNNNNDLNIAGYFINNIYAKSKDMQINGNKNIVRVYDGLAISANGLYKNLVLKDFYFDLNNSSAISFGMDSGDFNISFENVDFNLNNSFFLAHDFNEYDNLYLNFNKSNLVLKKSYFYTGSIDINALYIYDLNLLFEDNNFFNNIVFDKVAFYDSNLYLYNYCFICKDSNASFYFYKSYVNDLNFYKINAGDNFLYMDNSNISKLSFYDANIKGSFISSKDINYSLYFYNSFLDLNLFEKNFVFDGNLFYLYDSNASFFVKNSYIDLNNFIYANENSDVNVILYNNKIKNIYFDANSLKLDLNTYLHKDASERKKILDDASDYVGGNLWLFYNCDDSLDPKGICDTYYKLSLKDKNFYDYYPLKKYTISYSGEIVHIRKEFSDKNDENNFVDKNIKKINVDKTIKKELTENEKIIDNNNSEDINYNLENKSKEQNISEKKESSLFRKLAVLLLIIIFLIALFFLL